MIFLTLVQKDILFQAQESYEKTSTLDLDLSSKATVIRKTKCPLTNGFLMAICSQSQFRGNMKTICQKSLLRFQLFQNIVLSEVLFLGGESKTRVSEIVITHIFMSKNLFYRETQTQGLRTLISDLFDAGWNLLGCLVVVPTG